MQDVLGEGVYVESDPKTRQLRKFFAPAVRRGLSEHAMAWDVVFRV